MGVIFEFKLYPSRRGLSNSLNIVDRCRSSFEGIRLIPSDYNQVFAEKENPGGSGFEEEMIVAQDILRPLKKDDEMIRLRFESGAYPHWTRRCCG